MTAWTPLRGGLLTGRCGTDRERPRDSCVAGIGGAYGHRTLSERNFQIADALNAVARARSASAGQVVIA